LTYKTFQSTCLLSKKPPANKATTKKMADKMRKRCAESSLAMEVSVPEPNGLSISAVAMDRVFHLDGAASRGLNKVWIIQSTCASKASIKPQKPALISASSDCQGL
jgi:hypothetical protein